MKKIIVILLFVALFINVIIFCSGAVVFQMFFGCDVSLLGVYLMCGSAAVGVVLAPVFGRVINKL